MEEADKRRSLRAGDFAEIGQGRHPGRKVRMSMPRGREDSEECPGKLWAAR